MNNDIALSDKILPDKGQIWQAMLLRLEACFEKDDLEKAHDLFAEFQAATTNWLLSIAKSKLPVEDAHDAVAEVYLNLYDHLSQRRESVGSIKAFLRTLINRRIVDILRKRREDVREMEDHAGDVIGSDSEAGANPFAESEFRMIFDTLKNVLLQQMPSPEKEVLFLRHYHGLSVDETAKRLHLTVDMVKKRTQKAIDMAAELAAERGINL